MKLLKDKPLVSVIMPVHNSSSYIRETLSTIAAQTYKNIELVAADDNSNDNSTSIINEFRDKIAITLLSLPSVERSITRNLAIDAAHGDYFIFLDADDFLHPRCIETLLAALSVDESTFAVKCEALFVSSHEEFGDQLLLVDINDFKISEFDSTTFLQHGCFPINSILVKKNEHKFPPGISVCEDWHYWSRCLFGNKVISINLPLVGVHRHSNNSTTNEQHLMLGELSFLNSYTSLPKSKSVYSVKLGKLVASNLFGEHFTILGFLKCSFCMIWGAGSYIARRVVKNGKN